MSQYLRKGQLQHQSKAHCEWLKKHAPTGEPSLRTRQRFNKIKRQHYEDQHRANVLKQNADYEIYFAELVKTGQAIARWTPDPQAVARKAKLQSRKALEFFTKMSARAKRRFLGGDVSGF